jgi:hypothetical protein
VALACAVPSGDPLAATTFGEFRPVDFYGEAGAGEHGEHFVRSIRVEELNRRISESASGIRFAAALFSWDDVARDAIFDEDEAPFPVSSRSASLAISSPRSP